MKKLMTIVLAAALMFAVAAQVQAATPLETSAELRVRAFLLDSYTGYVAANGKSCEFWDQRLRLSMNWQVTETVKLQVRADILEGLWGDNSTSSALAVTEDSAGLHNVTTTTAGTPAKASIDFDWANMQFAWPGTPVTLTIGRQDAGWGPGIISKSDPRDRFKALAKFDFGTLGFVYQKRKEVFNAHHTNSLDDNRQYALLYMGQAAGFNFGIIELATFFNATANLDTTHYMTGAFATGKAGPADLVVDLAFMTGKNDFTDKADVDLQGIGAYAAGFVPAGPVTVGLEAAFCSGDKVSTKGKNEGAFSFDYHNPFWSVVLFNNMDVNGYAGETNVAGNSSVNNALAGKLSVVAKPLTGLTVTGAALYSQRNEVASGVKKPMGTELDLLASYAITPNVTWTVGAGYLMVGDFYKSGGKKADNALAALSNFTLKF